MARKFATFVEWNYGTKPEDLYERCVIYPVTPEEEQRDGDNCAGLNYGMDFYVSDTLEEAIQIASFNPFAIEFEGLTEEEEKQKDEFLSQYTWSHENGLKRRKEL